jgi:hypothetical protein
VTSSGTDWSAVVAPLVTGVVGLAGIIGTAWQGKRGREIQSKNLQDSMAAAADNLRLTIAAENRRAELAEKRRVYAAHLAACTEVHRAVIKKNSPLADKEAANLEYGKAVADVVAATAVVSLIAPSRVSDLAESASEKAGLQKPGGQDEYFSVRDQLIAAMRDDLASRRMPGVGL